MNQVLVQICFLVSGVVTGCAHVPYTDVPAYSVHQVQYVVVDQGPAFNLTAQPNWNNVKRNTQPRRNYVPYVVQRSNHTYKTKIKRRTQPKRRVIIRRHY